MNNQSSGGRDHHVGRRFRKRPLAACLAASMALAVAGPAFADGQAAAKIKADNLRSLLLSGQSSGNTHMPLMRGTQGDMAEAEARRMLGLQAPSVVTGGGTITVSNCNDSGPGSLRAAAGLAISGDTIDMSGLSCSVNLNSSIVTSVDDLTIQGNPNHKYPFINGQNATEPLIHLGTGTLTLSGVTVENGVFTTSSSSLNASGGCIYSKGSVVLQDAAEVKYCTAEHTGNQDALGGAIYSAGSTSVGSGSVVTGGHAKANSGNAMGGGIYAKGGVSLKYGVVANSSAHTVSGTFVRGGGFYSKNGLNAKYSNIGNNKAYASGTGSTIAGGGAWVSGSTSISFSSIYSNQADSAAAMVLGRGGSGTSNIKESTIANNKALKSNSKYGGGLYLGNSSTINNCTITGNTEKNAGDNKYGAGILIKSGTAVSMSSTIVSGNFLIHSTSGNLNSDIRGNSTTPATITGDHNLIGFTKYTSTPGDTISDGDPKLGPLQDNGGLTLTTAVLSSSAAIDAGTANSDTADQRGSGFTRTVGAAPDIGAFERGADIIFANGFESP